MKKYGLDHGRFMTDRHGVMNFDKLRQDRLERAQAQMAKDGLGSLLLFEPWNVRYATGFCVPVYARSDPRFFTLVPRNGTPYLWAPGGNSLVLKEEMPWLKGNVKVSMGAVNWMIRESAVYGGGFIKEIADILVDQGILNEPMGIDGIATSSPLAIAEACKKVGIRLADGSSTMLNARKIKTNEEIELIRISISTAEAAFADARETIRPGITEGELVGVIMKRLFAMGAEWVDGCVCCFGENTNPNRLSFSDRTLRPGDMGFIDIVGSQFCGYRTCYYRTFTVGKATQEQKDMYQSLYEMQYAGMSAVKAGNTTLDIVKQWPPPEHWGYDNEHIVYANKMGHGVGLSQYDLPTITTPLATANPVVLEENMVIALECWEGKRGGKQGCRIEEMVAVTKDGYDLLTLWPIKEITECWT